jgi:endonuclease G
MVAEKGSKPKNSLLSFQNTLRKKSKNSPPKSETSPSELNLPHPNPNMLTQKQYRTLFALLTAIGLLLLSHYVSLLRTQNPHPFTAKEFRTEVSDNLKYGNPSQANTSDKDNYLVNKSYFVLSYNNAKGEPNWVAWKLTASDTGDAPRMEFHPDQTLPQGFKVVTPNDYTRSGFDRGHVCPHDDRSNTNEASYATFVMSNMLPQAPDLNRKTWAELEEYCRAIAKHDKTIYIIAGGIGTGGIGENGPATTIGPNQKVVVPTYCWKVILVLDKNEDFSQHPLLFAVAMPNEQGLSKNWKDYLVPVDKIEKNTGYTFFANAPQESIEPLKHSINLR